MMMMICKESKIIGILLGNIFIIFTKWTIELAKILYYCFHRIVRLCVCVNQTQTVGALNANSYKTVKATDFKFDVHVSRNCPDLIP